MKYATLIPAQAGIGLALVLASIVTVRACDHYIYVCKPGLTEVLVRQSDGGEICDKAVKYEMYYIGNKSFPASSPFFKFSQRDDKDILYYRGQRCLGPYYN